MLEYLPVLAAGVLAVVVYVPLLAEWALAAMEARGRRRDRGEENDG